MCYAFGGCLRCSPVDSLNIASKPTTSNRQPLVNCGIRGSRPSTFQGIHQGHGSKSISNQGSVYPRRVIHPSSIPGGPKPRRTARIHLKLWEASRNLNPALLPFGGVLVPILRESLIPGWEKRPPQFSDMTGSGEFIHWVLQQENAGLRPPSALLHQGGKGLFFRANKSILRDMLSSPPHKV